MKKDIKLYNMIFPTFMLFALVPHLWIASIVGNFIIDSLLLLIIDFAIFKHFNKDFYKKSFKKVYFLGFLGDILGTVYLIAMFLIYAVSQNTPIETFIDKHINIIEPIFYISGIIVAGVLIYIFDYFISFKNTELSKKQKIFSALTFAVVTAPYTYLIPPTVIDTII